MAKGRASRAAGAAARPVILSPPEEGDSVSAPSSHGGGGAATLNRARAAGAVSPSASNQPLLAFAALA